MNIKKLFWALGTVFAAILAGYLVHLGDYGMATVYAAMFFIFLSMEYRLP